MKYRCWSFLLLAIWPLASVIAQNAYPFPASGNVGIGTASPSSPLQVYGAGNANLGTLRLDSGNPFTSITSRQFDTASEPEGFTSLSNSYNSTDNYLSIGGGLDEFNAATVLRFYTAATPTIRTGTVRMAIDSNGNVGIGTPTPTSWGTGASLEVDAAGGGVIGLKYAGASKGYLLGEADKFSINGRFSTPVSIFTSGSERMRISAEGNVGIGTVNPSYRMEIFGSNGTDTRLGFHQGMQQQWSVGIPASATRFAVRNEDSSFEALSILSGTGNVGIGTTNPSHKLPVNGTVKAKEITVETTGWSDYVFDENYRLAPLSEVDAHIKAEKHLPGIPSAQEVAEQGVSVGEMQAKLLAKVEELTLHLIRLEKENAALRTENSRVQERLQRLESR